MQQQILELAQKYRMVGEEIHDAIREIIENAGGFIYAADNSFEKPDINCLLYNKGNGITEFFPIRALRVNEQGRVEVYIGTYGAFYTKSFLQGKRSEEHWMPLMDSGIVFYPTIMSIAQTVEHYL